MIKASKRQNSILLMRSNTLSFYYSPAAAAQVEAPIDKKENDNIIIVAHTVNRELIIVCVAPLSALTFKYRGMTNLAVPVHCGLVNDKHSGRPHNQTSEGKADGYKEKGIGTSLRIWHYCWVPRRNRRAKCRCRRKNQSSLDRTSQSKSARQLCDTPPKTYHNVDMLQSFPQLVPRGLPDLNRAIWVSRLPDKTQIRTAIANGTEEVEKEMRERTPTEVLMSYSVAFSFGNPVEWHRGNVIFNRLVAAVLMSLVLRDRDR